VTQLQGLYVITDEQLMPADTFLSMAEQALAGGARVLQYRDKSGDPHKRQQQAQALMQLCREHDAVFIVNDDVELALQVDADGVHLGAQDASLTGARNQLGAKKIIGVSCYNRIELANTAAQQGADYIAFGSFFVSPTKPEAVRAETALIGAAKNKLALPVCAIGGINSDNAAELIQAGVDMLAVISDIWTAPDIMQQCTTYKSLLS